MISENDPASFIVANTRVLSTPLVPEIRLHLADEMFPLWHLTEEELSERGLPPPFWAFAWAGGQALARFILDCPNHVTGKRVLDFAAGSGLVGIAAALGGASSVTAVDIDRYAGAACLLNATANQVELQVGSNDLLDEAPAKWDLILAGDVLYEQPMAGRVLAWLETAHCEGTEVLVGDPGRTYLPKRGFTRLAVYQVETSRELEDNAIRRTQVLRLE